MEKAYDLKALGEKLKAAGIPLALDAAEAAAGKVYVAMKEWAQESSVLSENKIDDFIVGFFGQIDSFVVPQIDKINGKIG